MERVYSHNHGGHTWAKLDTFCCSTTLHRRLTVITKRILAATLPEDWIRQPGWPSIMWLKTVHDDLELHNLALSEAINMAQNWPLWKLLAPCGTMHCCQPEMKMMNILFLDKHTVQYSTFRILSSYILSRGFSTESAPRRSVSSSL